MSFFGRFFERDRDRVVRARSTLVDPKFLLRKNKQRAVHIYAARYSGGRLIDLGCGSASFRQLFEGRVDRYIRFDYPATRQSMGYGDTTADILGDVRAVPLESGSLDSVLLLDVLEHVFEVDQVLGGISRILKPGGTLLLTTPFIYPVHGKPYDFHRFSLYALEKHLEKHELRILEHSVIGGYGAVLAVLLNQFLFRTFLGNVKPLYVVGLLLRPFWLAAVVAFNCLGYVLDAATRRRPTWVYLENAVICERL